jgi:hypothetical protein
MTRLPQKHRFKQAMKVHIKFLVFQSSCSASFNMTQDYIFYEISMCCGLYIETSRTSLEKTESDKTAFPHYV